MDSAFSNALAVPMLITAAFEVNNIDIKTM